MPHPGRTRDLLLLAALAAAALLVHGYHLGVEDQAIYLPAIKKNLDPALYPHDAEFFLAQTRLALFDETVALSRRMTRLPLGVAMLVWQFAAYFAVLLGCWRIARRCFASAAAHWAGVGLVAALFTLPVAGTRLLIVDQYLHPRILATAALLFAVAAVLDRKWVGLTWLLPAAAMHPQMTMYGLAHLLVLAWRPLPRAALALPAALVFLPAADPWRDVVLTRKHHFPLEWAWYELLGAIAPLALLAWFAWLARRRDARILARLSARLALSGGLGVAAAFIVTMVPQLERFVPFQPMRSLHLVYLFLILLGGGLLGECCVRTRLRLLLFLLPICGVMFCAQRLVFPASAHIEWPGGAAGNAWVEAFDWVRQNTPRDALFALDPRHMERPGQDFHGFRALAERSMLADYVKDRGVAALFPALADKWAAQMENLAGWEDFGAEDFRRLKEKYGVTWVVVEPAQGSGLDCPYGNDAVRVCKVD